MTKQMKSSTGIEQIPEGYKLEYGYVIPKEWKIVRFDKCFHRLTQKNVENNQNVLTISAQQGLISQLDYYNTLYASEDKTGYFLLQKGDFAYNKSYSTDYAYGAIKQLEKYEKGIVSPLYICFSANKDTNADFYRQYFEAGRFNREIYKIAQEGARNHGLLNVSTPEFFSAALVYPPVAEQKKIAQILAQCDKVIELKQELIAELNHLKKALLQAMFPAEGHKQPEIRFSGFTADWAQRKLTEFVDFFSGLTYTPGDVQETGTLVLRSSNVSNGEIVDADNVYVCPQVVNSENVREGDIIVVVRNGSRSLIGKHAQIKRPMPNTVIGAFMAGIRSKCPAFTNALLNTSHFDKKVSMNLGATINQITGYMFSKMEFNMPGLDEQREIGDFFENLDDLIALRQRELEGIKKKKKALAQLLLTGVIRVKP